MLSQTSINLKGGKLQNDNVFVDTYEKTVLEVTGCEGRKGYEKMIFSGGKLVNVVSKNYGHLLNENFFLRVENELINADIHYITRSINRNDGSFAVDYILNDDSYEVKVKMTLKTLYVRCFVLLIVTMGAQKLADILAFLDKFAVMVCTLQIW